MKFRTDFEADRWPENRDGELKCLAVLSGFSWLGTELKKKIAVEVLL